MTASPENCTGVSKSTSAPRLHSSKWYNPCNMADMETTELSEREREILSLVATGVSNKEIAQQLYISTNTVRVHLRNIFSKIGVNSRTEAAMYAVKIGLVQTNLPENGGVNQLEAQKGSAGEVRTDRPLFASRGLTVLGLVVIVMLAVIGTLAILRIPDTTASSNSPPTTPTVEERWQELASLPTPREGLAAAVYDNQIFTIGGRASQGVTGIVERYDLQHNTWQTLAVKPLPVTDIHAAVVGGKIYVPGGLDTSGRPSAILAIYDPASNQWEQGHPLPIAVSAYGLAAYEGRIYLFGGWDGLKILNTVLEYDPSLDQWEIRTPMPTSRSYPGVAVSGAKIYAIGGSDGTNALQVNEIYSPDQEAGGENPWTSGSLMPEGRYSMGMTSIADIIYIVGGKQHANEALPLLEYQPSSDSWEATPSLSQPWSGLAMTTMQFYVFAIGGRFNTQLSSLNLSYQAVYSIAIPLVK